MTAENAVNPEIPNAPKKSSFGCLKILAILGAVVGLMFIILVILGWQSYSWARNGPEPAMAVYPPLNLSEGEKEDVQRIIAKISAIKQTREVVDEYVTPDVFNGIMEEIIEGERKKQKNVHDEPEYFRAGFAGEDFQLKLTKQVPVENAKQPMYINLVTEFKFEITDGRITEFAVDKLLIHDSPPPLLARIWIHLLTKSVTEGKDNNAQVTARVGAGNTNWVEVFKLLKREGDRVHVIIDGSKMKD